MDATQAQLFKGNSNMPEIHAISRKLIFFLIAFFIFISACSNSKNEKTQNESKNLSPQAQTNKTDITIKLYQDQIKKDPTNYSGYTRLGESCIQKARETGDVTYYNMAEEVLRKALELNPGDYPTVVYMGQVSASKHDFRGSLPYAQKAIEVKPEQSYAYGVLGDDYAELGEYDKAEKAYKFMLTLRPSFYSYSRISYIEELRGNVQKAIEAMENAIRQGRVYAIRYNQSTENVAWAQFMLGELYFKSGNLKKAEEQYKASLKSYDNYYYALAGLGRVRAEEKKYGEAIELYKKAIGIIPLPLFVSSLGDVYKKTGKIEEAKKQYDLVEYIGLLSKINKIIYNRDLALFYADHDMKLDEALDLAKKELEVRRDIYTYDTLAWTLYKNNQFKVALKASQESLKLGTMDAILFFHAGMIYYKLGDMDKAKEYLSRAISINPYFHIIYLEVAQNTLKEVETKSSTAKKTGSSL
jgi:tetratricopeptide (TPR) repeat protein